MPKNGSKIDIAVLKTEFINLQNTFTSEISKVNESVQELTRSFRNLESGRLSHLELAFANLQGRIAIISGIISVTIGILFIFVEHYLK